MAREFGAVEDYQGDQLVVALPDLGLVEEALTKLHVAILGKDSDERLGLALLSLGGVTEAVGRLRQDQGLMQRSAERKWPRGAPPRTGPSDLDLLLYKLREDSAAVYGGWMPVIGKNRMIAPVRGFPYVSGCTEGDPRLLGFADPNPEITGGTDLGQRPRPAEPGQGVRVGLLDTELYPHPWLAGGYLASEHDLLKSPEPGDPRWATAGHGTFIAGLILQRAPGAALIVRRAMGQDARGKTWGVAKAMALFADRDVHVLNLSFGCYTDDGEPPLVLAKAVSLLSSRTLLVAAAGNHGDIEELKKADNPLAKADWMTNVMDTTPVWPAAFPEVTAVGATDENGQLADFTPKVPWIDVIAPGVNVESTYLNETVRLADPASAGGPTRDFHGLARWDGTSFAAGTVSGAVAAKIGPGRNARQALQAVLDDDSSGIERYR